MEGILSFWGSLGKVWGPFFPGYVGKIIETRVFTPFSLTTEPNCSICGRNLSSAAGNPEVEALRLEITFPSMQILRWMFLYGPMELVGRRCMKICAQMGLRLFTKKHEWLKFVVHVGKYSSPMEHLGYIFVCSFEIERLKLENQDLQTGEPRKKPGRILSIESWLFNRNPYFMLYEIIPT